VDDKGYPKFQYSVFDKTGGKDGQWVIRGDDFTSFMEDRALVMEQLASVPSAPVQPATTVETTSTGYPCKACGGATVFKTGTSAKGIWRGYFCTVNKDHTPAWLK